MIYTFLLTWSCMPNHPDSFIFMTTPLADDDMWVSVTVCKAVLPKLAWSVFILSPFLFL
jgi:hypothetical protein